MTGLHSLEPPGNHGAKGRGRLEFTPSPAEGRAQRPSAQELCREDGRIQSSQGACHRTTEEARGEGGLPRHAMWVRAGARCLAASACSSPTRALGFPSPICPVELEAKWLCFPGPRPKAGAETSSLLCTSVSLPPGDLVREPHLGFKTVSKTGVGRCWSMSQPPVFVSKVFIGNRVTRYVGSLGLP